MPQYNEELCLFRSANEKHHFYSSPKVVWFVPSAVGLTAGFFVGVIFGIVLSSLRYGFITGAIFAFVVWGLLTSWILQQMNIKPRPTYKKTEIEWKENDGRTLRFVDLETADDDQFYRVCKMVNAGGSLSLRYLRKYFINDTDIEHFKLELVAKKLAFFNDPNNHKQGMGLTRAGEIIFRQFPHAYESNTTPPPWRSHDAQ